MGHKTQNTKQNTKHKTQSLKIVETHQQCMMVSNTMKVVTVAFCIVTPILGANPIIQRIMREEARATHGRRLAVAVEYKTVTDKNGKYKTVPESFTLTAAQVAAVQKNLHSGTTWEKLKGKRQKNGERKFLASELDLLRRYKLGFVIRSLIPRKDFSILRK